MDSRINSHQYFYDLLFNASTKQGRLFMLLINLLIVISMVAFSLSTLPNISDEPTAFFDPFEILIVAIFTFKYSSLFSMGFGGLL